MKIKTKRPCIQLFLSGIFFIGCSFQNFAVAKIETVLGLPLNANSNLAFKNPETSNPEIVLSRDQYIISYNKITRTPNYVAWKLDASQIGSSGRSNNFAMDEELDHYLVQTINKHAVDSVDYKGSCYDRGHQVPSADRTDSVSDNEQTFLMSNMIPQTAYLNRVIWEHLEQYSRDLVQKQGKKLFILAGPIYDKAMGAIGPDKDIQVPSKNFKVIYVLNANQGPEQINAGTPSIAVIMPNILQNGSTDLSDKTELCKPVTVNTADRNDWQKYKTTLSEVEKLSGLKFSPSKI
jgi:endonuclease G